MSLGKRSKDDPIRGFRQALSGKLEDLEWHVVGRLAGARLERALAKETAKDHPLFGKRLTAIARSARSDDVLFASDTGLLAQVHLTFSGKSNGPDWPSTGFFESVEGFLNDLRAERSYEAAFEASFSLGAEYPEGTLLCPRCGSDWGDGEANSECPLCDGWALARPCPECDGACGEIWTRAVLDSLDEGVPVWIGTCAHRAG